MYILRMTLLKASRHVSTSKCTPA